MERYENISFRDQFRLHWRNCSSKASHVFSELSELSEAHLELLDEEVKQQKESTLKVLSFIVAAVIAGLFTIFVLTATAVYLLVQNAGLALGVSLGILAAVWLALTAVFFSVGMSSLKDVNIVPRATIDSIKETFRCLYN